EVDGQVQAWAFLDPDHARAQARAADEWRGGGRPIRPLHGVPIGIKDIIYTPAMPTENGPLLPAGRPPPPAPAGVQRAPAAGAVILGKTVTTEFAAYAPGKAGNRHDGDHTPGGSSSGSAAAVAAGMVALAVGSQTNGSVIRPAAFCGVYGFKPTFGSISRHGMLRVAPTLDQVGVFARTVDDLAFVTESLVGYDARDPDSRPRARPPLRAVAAAEPPLPPMFAFVKPPHWPRTDEDTKAAFGELVELLGDRVEELELFPSAVEAWTWHRTIMEAEMAASLEREWDVGRDRLSEPLRALLERGRAVSALDYQR